VQERRDYGACEVGGVVGCVFVGVGVGVGVGGGRLERVRG